MLKSQTNSPIIPIMLPYFIKKITLVIQPNIKLIITPIIKIAITIIEIVLTIFSLSTNKNITKANDAIIAKTQTIIFIIPEMLSIIDHASP